MTGPPSAAPSAENIHDPTELINFFPNGIDPETANAETIRKYVKFHFRKYAINDLEDYPL